jgi:predicted TIM-barrel fold metal-dependent hydrolase
MYDAHFHLLPEEIYRDASFYNESWGGLDGHLKRMDEAGVGRALISYPTTDYHVRKGMSEVQAARLYNDAVKEIAGASGGRLSYLAAMPLTEQGEMIEEMHRAVGLGASGLSMPTNGGGVYPDDAKFLPFFEDVEKARIPVFLHPTTMTPFGHEGLRHPLITPVFQYAFDTSICMAKVVESGLLGRFHGLKLVFASLGGVMPVLAGRFDRTYRMLHSRGIVGDLGEDPGMTLRKIYVDTGGATAQSVIKLALEVFGEDRILWGSDFPANRDIAGTIEAVNGLGVSGSVKEKILGGNLTSCLSF